MKELIIATLVVAGIMFAFVKLTKNNHKRSIHDYIVNHWGESERELEINYKAISSLYYREPKGVDDITWADLDMNLIFETLNSCYSFLGEMVLYNKIRNPMLSEKDIENYQEKLKVIGKNKTEAIEIQKTLYDVGRKEVPEFVDLFTHGMKEQESFWKPLINILSFSIIYVAIGVIFFPKLAIFLGISLFSINTYCAKHMEQKTYGKMDSMLLCGRMYEGLREISKMEGILFTIEKEEMKALAKKLGPIKRAIGKINMDTQSDMGVLAEFANILYLRKAKAYLKFVDLFDAFREELLQGVHVLGGVDADISLASMVDTKELTPMVVKEEGIDARNMIHPLLEKPVGNSIDIEEKGILLTGSNASGKSTFLRTLGINQILGQSIGYVFAEKYSSELLWVSSAIDISDNLLSNDSYFVAEGKAIYRMMEQKKVTSLLLLDEIFRGTNTIDRISAATATLKYLSKESYVVAATHDVELTVSLHKTLDNYHFDENIRDGQMNFDYKLKEGPAKTRNAIAILELLQYPKVITESALKMAGTLEKDRMDFLH